MITLPGAICDRNRTAETIVRVQTAEAKLTPILSADPAFGGAWYEHAPCYRLVLAFTDWQPRQWVVGAAPPELRPYIAFSRTRLSEAERDKAAHEIMRAVEAAGVRFAIFTSSVRPEEFMLGVRTPNEARIARAAVPERYRPITRIEVGSFERHPE